MLPKLSIHLLWAVLEPVALVWIFLWMFWNGSKEHIIYINSWTKVPPPFFLTSYFEIFVDVHGVGRHNTERSLIPSAPPSGHIWWNKSVISQPGKATTQSIIFTPFICLCVHFTVCGFVHVPIGVTHCGDNAGTEQLICGIPSAICLEPEPPSPCHHLPNPQQAV